MIELNSKRSLNAKHFDNKDGSLQYEPAVGHIHYFDKLDSKRFREIDWTLNFDETKRGWYFNYHSFRPFLPEYADEWVEFRDLFADKDQTVKYKAVASHTKGRLVAPSEIGLKGTGVNCVIYDDAFGEGFDYILYFTRSTLKKVVRIRDGFKPTEDISFDFEVEFPSGKKFRTQNKETISDGYEFIEDTEKVFNSNKQLIIGDDKDDGKEWFTYLKDFKCWDDEKAENISVNYLIKDGKKYLRKNITKEFLASSVGDVFTDTTTSYYAGSGDGRQFGVSDSDYWSKARSDSPDGYISTTDDGDWGGSYGCGSIRDSSSTVIGRTYLPIDTSGLGSGATVTAATLYAYAQSTEDFDNDGDDFVGVVHSFQYSNTALQEDDWADCGSASDTAGTANTGTITEGHDSGERNDISVISLAAYTTWDLNSTGLGWISLTSYTKLGLREGHDILDHEINSSNSTKTAVSWYYSEYTGTSQDPYLSITYTPGAAAEDNAIFFGMNF